MTPGRFGVGMAEGNGLSNWKVRAIRSVAYPGRDQGVRGNRVKSESRSEQARFQPSAAGPDPFGTVATTANPVSLARSGAFRQRDHPGYNVFTIGFRYDFWWRTSHQP